MTKSHKNLHSRKFSSEISKMLESFSLNSLRSEVRSVKQALEIEEFHVH